MLSILRALSGGKEMRCDSLSNVQVNDIASTEANINADHDLHADVTSDAIDNPDHDSSKLNQFVQQDSGTGNLSNNINTAIISPIKTNSALSASELEDTEEGKLLGGTAALKAITTNTETGHNSPSNGSTVDNGSFTNISQPNLNVSKNMKLYQRLSLSSLGFLNIQYGKLASNEHQEELKAQDAARKSIFLIKRSQRRAKTTALTLRTVLVGQTGDTNKLKETTNSTLKRIKAQLLDAKIANQIIAQLRIMPVSSNLGLMHAQGPIHAVCLEHPDVEVASSHFQQLKSDSPNKADDGIPSVANAAIESLGMFLRNLHVINLLSSPDLGLGQPGDGDGILSGAVPTAATVINGIEQITPQLMALGYATGRSIVPDHKGVNMPLDRMSIITYWWGLEIAMPEKTMKYLSDAQSIQHSLINFLTALSLVDDGVRELVPFVRYISQFMDFEWNSIKAQDKGKGVVCAATWLMPAALVPRPWDFPDSPAHKAPISALPIKPAQPSIAPGVISPEVSVGVGTEYAHTSQPIVVITAATLPRSAAAQNDLSIH